MSESDESESRLEEEAAERQERLQRLAEDLQRSEMADSVVILTTYHRDGFTQYASGASGNSFASVGSAEKYVKDGKDDW